jgi:hypothetical protein
VGPAELVKPDELGRQLASLGRPSRASAAGQGRSPTSGPGRVGEVELGSAGSPPRYYYESLGPFSRASAAGRGLVGPPGLVKTGSA